MRKEFTSSTPELALVITPSKKEAALAGVYEKILAKEKIDFVVLPLIIKKSESSKIIKVIKLMDIKGAHISKKLSGENLVYKNGEYKKIKKTDSISFQIAENIRQWTGKIVDSKKIDRILSRIGG